MPYYIDTRRYKMNLRKAIVELAQETGLEVMQDVTIHKTLTDMRETYSTPEYKEIFKAVVDEHSRHMLKFAHEYKDYKAHFTDEGIYEEFELREGFRVMHKVETGCCISDCALNQVLVFDNEFFIKFRRNRKKCQENRKFFARGHLTVME